MNRVYRFSQDKKRSILVNSGDRWRLISDLEMDNHLDEILDGAEEEDVYELWYHRELL
jgi:hypothetical protein